MRGVRGSGDGFAFDADSPSHVFSEHPLLGYEMKPNWYAVGRDGEKVRYTNSHGQHDVERSPAKPPGVFRILMLGDSVVEEAQERDEILLEESHRYTLPSRLEQIIARELGAKVEVLNFGVQGYGTRAEIESLRVKGTKFSPDLVLINFVVNDFNETPIALKPLIEELDGLRKAHGFRVAFVMSWR